MVTACECALLAREFGVARSRVEIRHGQVGRGKLVRIESPGRIPASLEHLLTIA
jgi:uncharacterized protein YggU (UPF0235/DUF167 family)